MPYGLLDFIDFETPAEDGFGGGPTCLVRYALCVVGQVSSLLIGPMSTAFPLRASQKGAAAACSNRRLFLGRSQASSPLLTRLPALRR